MNLKRLVYLSRLEAKLTTKDIYQIIETSEKNNEANGLSGLLVYSKRSFLQVIEGDIYKLNGTFAKICRDPRHSDISIVEFTSIENRLFANWTMKLFCLDDFEMPENMLERAESSPYYPFPIDADLFLEILLWTKHR